MFIKNFEYKLMGVMHHTVVVKKVKQLMDQKMILSQQQRKIDHKFQIKEFIFDNFRWSYKTSSDLQGSSSSGLISRYGGGGYILDLKPKYDEAKQQLDILKQNLWISRGTRVVFLDFTLYNANINLFCQIKLTVEFPASGGAVASKTFQTVKLIRVSYSNRIEKKNKRDFLFFFNNLSMFQQWIILY